MQNGTTEQRLKDSTIANLIDWGLSMYGTAMDNSIKTCRYANYNTNAWLNGNVFPAMDSVLQMNLSMGRSLLDTIRGQSSWRDLVYGTAHRLRTAQRYARLVATLGKQIFGSVTFPGETVLTESKYYKLSYLPPQEGVPRQEVALFHSGGCIPYGDGIFRLTPEYNLYSRFLERGIPVYAMEYRGDSKQNNYARLDINTLVDTIAQLSNTAFAHNEERKMVMEGYCGHGTQALAYLAGRPDDAQRKFSAFCSFVAPYDGTRCSRLSEPIQATPEILMETQLTIFDQLGRFIPGDVMRMGLDMSLNAQFYKTALGYFSAGWANGELSKVKSVDDLNARQKRELAGAYWISTDCAKRYPVPVDVIRYTSGLFRDGITPQGDLPFTYKGTPLSIRTILEETDLKLFGFFGGLDVVVPDQTAHVMQMLGGDRYQHVVHPQAGHISYVLSPRMWSPTSPYGFKPNPIDLILAAGEAALAPAVPPTPSAATKKSTASARKATTSAKKKTASAKKKTASAKKNTSAKTSKAAKASESASKTRK